MTSTKGGPDRNWTEPGGKAVALRMVVGFPERRREYIQLLARLGEKTKKHIHTGLEKKRREPIQSLA